MPPTKKNHKPSKRSHSVEKCRDNKHRDDKYRDDKHRDDKYRDDKYREKKHREEKRHHKKYESSDSETETEITVKVEKKNDSSDSDNETEVTVKVEKKHEKKSRSHSRSKSRSRSRSHSRSKSRSRSRSHCKSSDSDCEDFDELYKYLKYKLLNDPQMMIDASQAYWYAYSNAPRTMLQNSSTTFDVDAIAKNVDHPFENAPGFVREDGYYVISFMVDTNESCQFTVFVNEEAVASTTAGNNAGAGQFISSWILPLRKNDSVNVRNYQSAIGALTIPAQVGGSQMNVNMDVKLFKIAPLNEPCLEKICLSKRKEHLFCELEKKMLCDPCLQLEGFKVHGSFFTKTEQIVATEAAIVFDSTNNVNGLTPVPLLTNNGKFSQVRIEEDGVYNVYFLATTDKAAQLCTFVNGVAIAGETVGTNKGAGQLTNRSILKLVKGDLISVHNHTSSTSEINLSQDAGGSIPGISAQMIITKISPAVDCQPIKCAEKWEKCYGKMYPLYRQYLLHKHYLQAAGSDAFIHIQSCSTHTYNVGDGLIWDTNIHSRNVCFVPGTANIVIERDGEYVLYSDAITERSAQWTAFVNNLPLEYTSSGRDSGANRDILRNILTLKKGDVLSIRNWKSSIGAVSTTQYSGGLFVNSAAQLILYKLNGLQHCPPPKPKNQLKPQ